MLTTNQKGFFAEAAVIKEAARFGIDVLRPLADARYDLVLDVREAMLRVQCKWAVRHGDVVVVRCRTCRRGREGLIHRGYNRGEIDAIAAYCVEVDKCYLLPLELSVERIAVQLRLARSRNNQKTGINWARDYEFEATLSKLYGPIAQLGERLSGTQKVAGSSPAGSTDSEAA
jgi:PD-(D/E)XK nuclease superfamily protein